MDHRFGLPGDHSHSALAPLGGLETLSAGRTAGHRLSNNNLVANISKLIRDCQKLEK